jgi:cytochrome P450 family 142 subfamily A polypeptide 1
VADQPTHPDINLLSGDFYADDPHRYFSWMREHAPVYWDPQSELWGIAKHADVMRVSKDPARFCNSQGMRPDSPPLPSMINMDDPAHKLRRNLVNRGFTPRRVQEHESRIRAICRELIAKVAPSGSCDFVRDIAAPLPLIVIGDLLGVEQADLDDLLRWSDDLMRGAHATAPPEAQAAAGAAFGQYAEYNKKVVADRRARPAGDDLMSILVHAEIDGEKLDDQALLQESLLILIGGDETTRHVITGGMLELIRNPEQRALLLGRLDDPDAVPLAVEEMLRWVTPIQNMSRTVVEDTELHGQTLRAGDKLLLLYPSANRDEEVFERPFEFDITRNPNDHVAFGGYGAHFCLGSSLARLEMRCMFEELLRALPDIEIAEDAELPMRPSNFITGVEHMPVNFEARELTPAGV